MQVHTNCSVTIHMYHHAEGTIVKFILLKDVLWKGHHNMTHKLLKDELMLLLIIADNSAVANRAIFVI